MRVNIYSEEMTDRIEIVSKIIDGQEFTGLRFYLELPVTQKKILINGMTGEKTDFLDQIKGPFIHREGDDDSSAVTFWGKGKLREVLVKALDELDTFYKKREQNRKFTEEDI